MKNFKLLGLTVAVALALTATIASSASASQFQSAAYPTTISGGQEGELAYTLEGGLTTKCKKVTASGSQAAATSTLTIAWTWVECTSFGLSATVNFGSCDLLLHAGSGSADTYIGTFDFVCTSGAIVISTATCEVQIGAQNGLGELSFVNSTPNSTIKMQTNLSKIKYNKTKDGFLCPLNGTGEKTDGTIVGNAKFQGSNGAILVG